MKKQRLKGDVYHVIRSRRMHEATRFNYPKKTSGLFVRSGIAVKRNGLIIQRYDYDELRFTKQKLLVNYLDALGDKITESESRRLNMLLERLSFHDVWDSFSDLRKHLEKQVANYLRPEEITLETYGSRFVPEDELLDIVGSWLKFNGVTEFSNNFVWEQVYLATCDNMIKPSGKNLEYKEINLMGSNPNNKDGSKFDHDWCSVYDYEWRQAKTINPLKTGTKHKPRQRDINISKEIIELVTRSPGVKRSIIQSNIQKLYGLSRRQAKRIYYRVMVRGAVVPARNYPMTK